MKPGFRPLGRNIGGGIFVRSRRKIAGLRDGRDLLRVPLLDSAETAELALHAVVVAVVVGVARDEAVAANVVVGLNPLHHMHWERKACDPGRARQLVGHVELGGRGIFNNRLGAQIIGDAD